MSDMDLKLDGIACGILVEKTEKKKEFAEYLGIPYRTLQDWELGIFKAPDYVYDLARYKVKNELEKGNLIRKQQLQKECR